MTKGYIDLTNCDIELFNTSSYCDALFAKSEIDKIVFTEESLTRIKKDLNDFDNDFKNYIKKIKTINDKNDYRIIIRYKDGTYASMRFNRGNVYVKDGLITYLDGINNTGYGHSNEATIWKDLSNNGNDATLYNNPTWSNNSLTFDGQTNYGRLENTINMPFPNGVTLEAKMKIKSLIGTNSYGNTFFFGNWEDGGIGLIYMKENVFETSLYINEWKEKPNQNMSNIDEYYTVTVTYDNINYKIYINGTLQNSEVLSQGIAVRNAAAPFGIGCNPTATGVNNYSNVEFQNVLIYDRALTENEVMRNYQADLARY